MSEVLSNLEDREIILYNEGDKPAKVDAYRHLKETEVAHMMLPYIVEDIRISNRELERRTGINARTISKYRSGDVFLRLLSEYTSKRMVGLRALALEELERILANPKLNENTKIKYISVALAHSERMAEIALSGNAKKEIDVGMLIQELESM
jgi:hypothetical protein